MIRLLVFVWRREIVRVRGEVPFYVFIPFIMAINPVAPSLLRRTCAGVIVT
jgi:hypothetical protein